MLFVKRAFFICTLLIAAHGASAQTWTGLGGNDNWSTNSNWTIAPLNNGTAFLVFGGTTRLTPNIDVAWSINSLTFNNTAGAFVIGGTTLTIGAGGITNNDLEGQFLNNSGVTLNAPQTWTASSGALSVGANITTGGNLLTFNSSVNGSVLGGVISGSGGLVKNGTGDLLLTGLAANSFTGGVTVNAGTLNLNKSAGVAAFGGPLIIGDGAGTDTVTLNTANQIPDTSAVTINSAAVLNINNQFETINTLTVSSGVVTIGIGTLIVPTSLTMTAAGISSTGAGKLNLTGSLTTNAAAVPSGISGNLDFGNFGKVVNVAQGGGTVDLSISAAIIGGGFLKQGPGIMRLSGSASNTSTLIQQVTAGTLELAKTGGADAIGNTQFNITGGTVRYQGSNQINDAATVLINGGTLDLNGFTDTLNGLSIGSGAVTPGAGTLNLAGTLTATGGGASTGTIGGNLNLLGASRTFDISESALAVELDVSAAISNGALVKSNNGTMRLNGTSANTYGLTTVNAGTLLLGKTAGVAAIPGNLIIGDGTVGSIVRLEQNDQIADAASITINNNSVLDLLGRTDTVASLSFPAGNALVASGIGALTLTGDLAASAANLTNSIAGNLELLPGQHSFDIADGSASPDVVITAIVSDGTLVKNGAGELRLSGNNTASFILNAGIVTAAGNNVFGAGVLTLNGGTLATFGSRTLANPVALNGAVIVDGGNLTLTGAISGNGGITKNGGGTLAVAAGTAIAGNWTLNAGTLNSTNLGIVSHGSLTMNGGAFVGTLNNNGGTFTYNGGTFNGTLINQGNFNINSLVFEAFGGVTNTSTISLSPGVMFIADGTGLLNNGQINLNGGVINGGVPATNNGSITGYGAITGAGFNNNGLITQDGGNIELSSTASQSNFGNIDLAAGRQLNILSTPLSNSGTINVNGATIGGTQQLTNNFDGTIAGRGTILVPFTNNGLLLAQGGSLKVTSDFTNTATIAINGLGSSLAGGVISNFGTIQGNGSISNNINNTGTIEAIDGTLILASSNVNNTGTINASTGNKILFSAATTNAGLINLTGGTFDANNHPLTNTGQISGYGTFRASQFTNNGSMTFSGGVSTINGNVTNSAGHQIRVAYNPAIFTGNVTNNGIFKNTSTTVTFAGTYTENGTFISDPADNFFSNVSIGPSGAWVGGVGDRFFVSGDFVNQSTNSTQWDTVDAELHLLASAGDAFAVNGTDLGIDFAGYDDNFAWGTLSLAAGRSLTLIDVGGAPGGALYVNNLDLQGGIDQISAITGNGMTLYYALGNPANSYLHGQTYSLAGGGVIAPVPEPAAALFALLAAVFLPTRIGNPASRRRRV